MAASVYRRQRWLAGCPPARLPKTACTRRRAASPARAQCPPASWPPGGQCRAAGGSWRRRWRSSPAGRRELGGGVDVSAWLRDRSCAGSRAAHSRRRAPQRVLAARAQGLRTHATVPHTFVPSWISLSIPRGPSVVRTASATAWHALMLLTSCALPCDVSVPSRSSSTVGWRPPMLGFIILAERGLAWAGRRGGRRPRGRDARGGGWRPQGRWRQSAGQAASADKWMGKLQRAGCVPDLWFGSGGCLGGRHAAVR
jgi:hypothetical protein